MVSGMAATAQSVSDISHDEILTGTQQTGRILRIIGEYTLGVPGSSGLYQVGIGIFVATQDGVLATPPDPLEDINQSWFYWDAPRLEMDAAAAAPSYTKPFEIRSGRRLRSGFRLGLVF